jgi:TusA-related sulfurtransferase
VYQDLMKRYFSGRRTNRRHLRTKIEIDRLVIGGRLRVLSDDPAFGQDIPKWVNRTGHELISISGNAGETFDLLIEKK